MSTWPVRNEYDRERVIKIIEARATPFQVNLVKGAPRSIEQNRLQRKWLLEAQEQGDQTAEEYRAFCKLHFGVPILRSENEDFRERYDRIIRHLDYEIKLELMAVPFDFAVTRIMTARQKTYYLDAVYSHFTGTCGFQLTLPGQEFNETRGQGG